ncbi:MAG: hypothetical protein EAZ51_06820 [Sphingobacteriales bacterium]|nr:MAG: hypothetical protein EAZ64_08400 [Sphingobacteriales bacterium]TAF80007.1 MAG: hypothetical protein EAZ51_06820 [Sphingobacteriales bacterium]
MQTLFSSQAGYIKTSTKFTVLEGRFLGVSFEMRYTEFFLLHQKLNSFNIGVMLFDLSDKPDDNKIRLQQGKCKITCTLQQLIALKNLFNGAMFYIRMQDVLYKNGINFSEICEYNLHENYYLVAQ